MATHGTNAHAQAINRDNTVAIQTQNLVGLGLPFPFLATLAVIQPGINPGNQAARERGTKLCCREIRSTHGSSDLAVNIKNRRGRISQLRRYCIAQYLHLFQELAHILCPGTGCCLIGHGRDPLNQPFTEQATQRHQHQADSAIATNKFSLAMVERTGDHFTINRIQHNNGIWIHTQRRGCINPVTFPAGRFQFWKNGFGVVATLTSHDHIHVFQCINAMGIQQCTCRLANIGTSLACL